MSDYMPYEIQVKIIERLPIISLIQFRSVSKTWKSLIDSWEFIARYNAHDSQRQRLLIGYHDPVASVVNYVSFADDDSFPQERFAPIIPLSVQKFYNSKVLGSCQGLFCLYGSYTEPSTQMAVLWNPSIRKSVAVALPEMFGQTYQGYVSYQAHLGFGVCPSTGDPKIIHISKQFDIGFFPSTPWQVKVFTLNPGAWRSRSTHLPRSSIVFETSQAVIDRFLYWPAYSSRITIDGEFQDYWLIASFDLTNDEFGEVYLPESLELKPDIRLSIYKLRESLAVIEYGDNVEMQGYYGVWMMEDGVSKSFKKLFTIHAPLASSINFILGFRNSGEPVLEVKNDRGIHAPRSGPAGLSVYEPYSEHINNIEIFGSKATFSGHSYVETLCLLNVPDLGVILA